MNTLKSLIIVGLSSIIILGLVGCSSSIVESKDNENIIGTNTLNLNNDKSNTLTHNKAYEIAYNKALQVYHTENIYSDGLTDDGYYSFIINTDTYTRHAYVDIHDGSVSFDTPIIYINNIGQDQAEKFASNYLNNYYENNYIISLDYSRMSEVSDWKFIAENTTGNKILLSVDCYGIVSEE